MPLNIECRSTYVRVSGSGLFSLAEAQEHFLNFSAALNLQRTHLKGARVLVDLRGGITQTREMGDYIAAALKDIYRREDRVAIIIDSTILKFQLRRLHEGVTTEVFLSETDAEAFLAEPNGSTAS